jgi:hypothetical protein
MLIWKNVLLILNFFKMTSSIWGAWPFGGVWRRYPTLASLETRWGCLAGVPHPWKCRAESIHDTWGYPTLEMSWVVLSILQLHALVSFGSLSSWSRSIFGVLPFWGCLAGIPHHCKCLAGPIHCTMGWCRTFSNWFHLVHFQADLDKFLCISYVSLAGYPTTKNVLQCPFI